jgi:hypothetical protein
MARRLSLSRLTLACALALLSACTRHLVVDDDAVNARALARVQQKTADARGLAFVLPIEAVVHRQDESRAFFADDAARVSDERWRREDQIAHRLGLLPDGMSLARVTPRVLGENAGGLYMPRARVHRDDDDDTRARLFIVPDVLPSVVRGTAGAFGTLTSTDWASELFLVHELVHALQDQHFDLTRVLPSALYADDSDRAMARKALLESEANLVAQAVLLGVDLESTVKRNLLIETLVVGRSVDVFVAERMTPDLPRVYTRLLVEQYTRGLRYLQALLDEGGLAALDAAYRDRLPDSTEQLLFPEKRLGPVLDAPRVLLRLDHDTLPHPRLSSNTMGALALHVILEEHLSASGAERAVTGWGGDRYDIFDDGERTLFVMRTLWDSALDAAEAHTALTALVRHKYPGRTTARENTRPGVVIFDVAAKGGDASLPGVRTTVDEAAAVVTDGDRLLWIEGAAPAAIEGLIARLLPLVRDENAPLDDESDTPVAVDRFPATLGTALIGPRFIDDGARTRAKLGERIHMPHHRLALRLGAGTLVTPPTRENPFPVSLALDRELRWGFRPGLEWAPPLLLSARFPGSSDRLLVTGTAGLTHVGFSFDSPQGVTFDMRSLLLLSSAVFLDDGLAVLLQGGAEGGVSSERGAPPVVELVSSLSALSSPWRPLTLAFGVALRTGIDVDTLALTHHTLRAPALVIGSAAWRGRAPVPVVEFELFDGLSLYGTSETVIDAASLRFRAQRTTGGLLVLF